MLNPEKGTHWRKASTSKSWAWNDGSLAPSRLTDTQQPWGFAFQNRNSKVITFIRPVLWAVIPHVEGLYDSVKSHSKIWYCLVFIEAFMFAAFTISTPMTYSPLVSSLLTAAHLKGHKNLKEIPWSYPGASLYIQLQNAWWCNGISVRFPRIGRNTWDVSFFGIDLILVAPWKHCLLPPCPLAIRGCGVQERQGAHLQAGPVSELLL